MPPHLPGLALSALSARLFDVTPDEPGGPGSDWSSKKVLTISLALGGALVLPLVCCLAHRFILTHKRKKNALALLAARRAAIYDVRVEAMDAARADGDDDRADAILELIERDRVRDKEDDAMHGQRVTRTGNLLRGYADGEKKEVKKVVYDDVESGSGGKENVGEADNVGETENGGALPDRPRLNGAAAAGAVMLGGLAERAQASQAPGVMGRGRVTDIGGKDESPQSPMEYTSDPF